MEQGRLQERQVGRKQMSSQGWLWYCGVGLCCVMCGCSGSASRRTPSPSEVEGTRHSRVEEMYGVYELTDYVWCSYGGTPPADEAAWAEGQVGYEGVILPEVCAVGRWIVVNPRYEMRSYPVLQEGDVACGGRRRLSDFLGIAPVSDAIVCLEAFEQGAEDYRAAVEVVDLDTLWETDGDWVFQWRRKGAKAGGMSLAERWRQSHEDD